VSSNGHLYLFFGKKNANEIIFTTVIIEGKSKCNFQFRLNVLIDTCLPAKAGFDFY